MAYGIPPQLYPYLYAPKSALGMHSSSLDSAENSSAQNMRHKSGSNSSKEYVDDTDERGAADESLSAKDVDEVLDENENVEID